MICLQKYLDLDQILAVRTAPGHSHRNWAEKINCLLNIVLYGIGCMRQSSTDPLSEQILSRCTGLGDACKLTERSSDRNTKLLKECCQPCLNLISETFSRLKLKDEQFKIKCHLHTIYRCWFGQNLKTKQYDDRISTTSRTGSISK